MKQYRRLPFNLHLPNLADAGGEIARAAHQFRRGGWDVADSSLLKGGRKARGAGNPVVERRFLGWAAILFGAVMMAAGGAVMLVMTS